VRRNLIIKSDEIQKMKWGKSKEIASQMGIAPNTLSRKIRGGLPMTMPEINKLAKILGVNTLALMQETYDDIVC
jgi:plasmid maintenance system antidote protein VapI